MYTFSFLPKLKKKIFADLMKKKIKKYKKYIKKVRYL